MTSPATHELVRRQRDLPNHHPKLSDEAPLDLGRALKPARPSFGRQEVNFPILLLGGSGLSKGKMMSETTKHMNRQTVTLDSEDYDQLIMNLARCTGILEGLGIRLKKSKKGALVMLDDKELSEICSDCKHAIDEAQALMEDIIPPKIKKPST